jgi:hypothetical protein
MFDYRRAGGYRKTWNTIPDVKRERKTVREVIGHVERVKQNMFQNSLHLEVSYVMGVATNRPSHG